MTARIALLMVAVVGLAACESTKAVDTSPSQPAAVQTASVTPPEPRVVRSPLVPDPRDGQVIDEYKPAKKRVKTASYDEAATATQSDPVEAGVAPAAPVSKPAKPAKTETAKVETPKSEPAKEDTAKTEPAPVTTADASTPADTTAPAPTDTAPDDSATPTTDATPVSDDGTKSMFSDPSAFMQAQIGGFPVWMIALGGIVLLALLLIGLGGRKKPEEVI